MIPSVPRFQLFGMGPERRKLLYHDGRLADALTGEVLHHWENARAVWEPEEYRVTLDLANGEQVQIVEDAEGVWLECGGLLTPLTRGTQRLRLPRFDNHPRAGLLRTLHAELLVNLMPFGPVPNLWVYPRPWYRDAAMMMMCFQKTGNLALVAPWVLQLDKLYDRNNAGAAEADNLGQLLYMISLVGDRMHPLVEKVLKAVPDFKRGRHIAGLTDGAERPVYQTKWLKHGLRALGLDDPYEIPPVVDAYSSLFWMAFKDKHIAAPRFEARTGELYPYLTWAEAHFFAEPPPSLPPNARALAESGVLSWEAAASEAEYWRMEQVSSQWALARFATPHTWHAAEMFLYYLEFPQR